MNAEEDGLVSPGGPRGNGARPKRIAQLLIEFDLDTGEMELKVNPPDLIVNRVMLYGLLETTRDIIYRHHLPGEMASIAQAQQRGPQIVVADGPLPPFRKP